MPVNSEITVRISVSLPLEDHSHLQDLARQSEVSIAWIVRQAVKDYLGKIDLMPRKAKRVRKTATASKSRQRVPDPSR